MADSNHTNPARHGAALRNERGIALLIVLIVVALLTITVTEFTYSVQIDQHRTRNAMHALQAQLLARSGVNLAEGFLMLDDEPSYDAYSELWWQQLAQFCQGMQLDESMRVRCRVRDESGKINVNNTRGNRNTPNAVTSDGVLRDAIRCIFNKHGIDPELVNKLVDYWQQEPQQRADGVKAEVPQFSSLEDFGNMLGITPDQIRQLTPFITAQPRDVLRAVNINTAPLEVVTAILGAEDCSSEAGVEEIVTRQCDPDHPFKSTGEIRSIVKDAKNVSQKVSLFDVRSKLYRLEASAVTNVDPADASGAGIGQTLSSLVARHQGISTARPGAQPAIGPNGKPLPNWTLRPVDWQKEGGARLFRDTGGDQDVCNPNGENEGEEPTPEER